MIIGAGYIFLAPQERRNILIDKGEREGLPVADPVKRFKHSTRAPIMVFGVFADGMITHLIDGRKGASAGTDLVRLNLSNWTRLTPSIDFERVLDAIAPRYRKYVLSTLKAGGLLPPKTMIALVEALIRLAPETRLRLARYSSSRRDRIRSIAPDALTNLALQKEAVSTSLAIAGFPQADVLAWDLPAEKTLPRSFLDGLPEAKVREDTMLEVDHGTIPGFALGRSTQIASKVFYREDGSRLTVVMANRTRLV